MICRHRGRVRAVGAQISLGEQPVETPEDGGIPTAPAPKRRTDQTRNRFYDNMKEVAPGDLVFSYCGGAIRDYGALRSFGYDAPKPDEFGAAGRNWSEIGHRSDVNYVPLTRPVAPRDAWDQVQPQLPDKYSPLNPANRKGLQSVYLAALPTDLDELLWRLVAEHGNPL